MSLAPRWLYQVVDLFPGQPARYSARQSPSSSLQSPSMDDTGRPAVLIAWIECGSCGRIDKAAHDFHYPADIAEDTQLFVWIRASGAGAKRSCICSGN
jgi:hypothetical protein